MFVPHVTLIMAFDIHNFSIGKNVGKTEVQSIKSCPYTFSLYISSLDATCKTITIGNHK